MTSEGEKYYFVSSLAKGLRALELLADCGEMSSSHMAKHLNTSRAVSHRYLTTLHHLGYAERTKEGRFVVSFKVLELGMKKLDGFEIRHSVNPFLHEMARECGEAVNLGHWNGKAIVHLDKINSSEMLRLDVGLGAYAPAYCTGLGKAILAFLPENELEAYLQSVEWVAMSPKTILTAEQLRLDLTKIRKRGYAVDDEELSLGLRCVAAPVFDHEGRPSYALSVSGPTQRMSKTKIKTIQTKLRPLCNRISRMIGAPEKSMNQVAP
jgi:DNA-binding IclR family transcriptional regulator